MKNELLKRSEPIIELQKELNDVRKELNDAQKKIIGLLTPDATKENKKKETKAKKRSA